MIKLMTVRSFVVHRRHCVGVSSLTRERKLQVNQSFLEREKERVKLAGRASVDFAQLVLFFSVLGLTEITLSAIGKFFCFT